jgi:hypothetical protein
MRQAVRRMVGIGGATAVAIGAAVVLAIPASAHTPVVTPACSDGQMTLSISLTNYSQGSHGKTNTVSATDTPAGGSAIQLVPANTSFGTTFKADFDGSSNPATGSASVVNNFSVKVSAWDDPTGSKGFSKTFYYTVQPCVAPPTTTTTTTTTTPPPPPSSTTTAPPTTTTAVVAPTSVSVPPTTTSAVVAAATTTPGSGSLPFTGVNTALPLGIAGFLVVVGGGLLFWLKFSARRRRTN